MLERTSDDPRVVRGMTEGAAAKVLACCLAMGWYVLPVCTFYWLSFLEWGKVMMVHGFRYLLALGFGAWGETEIMRSDYVGMVVACLMVARERGKGWEQEPASFFLQQGPFSKFPQSPNIPHIDEPVRLIRGWSQSLYPAIILPKPQVAATGRPFRSKPEQD